MQMWLWLTSMNQKDIELYMFCLIKDHIYVQLESLNARQTYYYHKETTSFGSITLLKWADELFHKLQSG